MSISMRYTREMLAPLAAESRSLDEMLITMGKEPETYRRKYLRKRLTAFGIDTSHFRSTGSIYTRELLETAVAQCTTVAGVVRLLQQRQAGGTHAHIGRRIKQFGIDTSHFTGQAHNRGKRLGPRRTPAELLRRLPPDSRRIPGARLRTMLVLLGRPERCEGCGTPPTWHGRPLTLEVDHIDGDWLNNQERNLRLLCPNCHATTETYCGRNKGKTSPPAP
ncbi:HNH endonuclease [Kitasatospora sp. LaBMicrA B282]|uniref:HNH endonuclease signature motif containing protein n=1 Tax=Kitasatospora sp. LaBMicrA B282 TaxID=3420949 RepID=UPI003D13B9DD